MIPPVDRRVTLVTTTNEGKALIDLSEHIGASLLAGPFATLDAESIRVFTDVFTRLAEVIEEWAQEPERWQRDATERRSRVAVTSRRPSA